MPPSTIDNPTKPPPLRPPVWPGLESQDAWEVRERRGRRWVWMALVLSFLIHGYLYFALKDDFLGLQKLEERIEQAQDEPFEMYVAEVIPEEEKAYVQTNPEVPENEPDRSPFVSNRSQQAAQENPVPTSDDPLPNISGEEESNNIVESTLEEPTPPSPLVQAVPDTGQPAPETVPQEQSQTVVAQGGGAPQVQEDAQEPTVDEAAQPQPDTTPSPAQPAVQPSQALNPITAISPPPDFLQGEPDPEADGEGLGLTPVEPATDTTPFQAQLKTRVIPTVRPSQPNFRVVAKTPQVFQQVQSESPRPSEEQGDTAEEAKEAESQLEPQKQVQSGTPGQDPRMPRPRPQILPRSTPGPLMDSRSFDAGREGTVSPDAEWSAFGDYQSRMLEAIANSWYRTLQGIQRRVGDSGTSVRIEFELLNDGSVRQMKTIRYSSSQLLMNICRDAIKSRDPYESWPQDMIDLFGESRTVTITFHYR
ncbi:MAG: hypothetical protein ACPGN3_10555 [Opitutales bacterium]